MAYIGNEPSVNFTSFAKQDLTGVTGSPAKRGFTLTYAVANANEIEVFVNNVRQEPTEAYTVSGTALTMTGDVETTDDFYIIYLGKALQTTVPPDASVSTAKIADSAVTNAKINNSTIDLTSKVTGVLPVANGGTGISSGLGLIIKRTVIAGTTGTVSSTSSYQTIKTYSFTPQANTVSMLVYFKTTASHRAGAFSFHRLKYDGDVLATQQAYDTGINVMFSSIDQDLFISTITLPKSGTLNFTYEGANTSSPAVGIGNNSTLTIVELGL